MEKNKTFLKALICIETLNLSINSFQEFLNDEEPSAQTTYYMALKFLENGKNYYQEALNEIRDLLGPLPTDATHNFREWKESYIKKMNIKVEAKELNALKSELQNDEFLLKLLTTEEIDVLLTEHYESQQIGRRKLSNIKARIILSKIENLITEAEALCTKSKDKLYQLR